MDIAIPKDRNGNYEPQLIKKYQNTVTQDMEEKILSMYAKFLEFPDKEGAKRNKDFRGFVERLYKMFMKQRKESMSPWALELMREHQKQRIQREQGQFPNQNTSAYDNSPFIIDNNNGDMDLMF